MSCDNCNFNFVYHLGETLKISVEIKEWDEETKTYIPVETLAGWDCKYIMRQGGNVWEFVLADPEISILGDYTFVVAVQPSEITEMEPGKVEHEFSTTDPSAAIKIIFSDNFSVKTSLLWQTS